MNPAVQSARLICLTAAIASASAADYRLLPESVMLHGMNDRHSVILAEISDNNVVGVARQSFELRPRDSAVVRCDSQNSLVPVGDGETLLDAVIDGVTVASCSVRVSGTAENVPWSFRHDVQSVLAKAGCNSGACHGALAGKGGFRLSLRGYDTKRDFRSVTAEQLGRRIDRTRPGLSLLLTKPTTTIPHKGGLRLETGSRDYTIIAEWIAQGAPGPRDDDPALIQLNILPKAAVLRPGAEQRFLVLAEYDDGRIRDVTPWAKFTSTNDAVATTDQQGTATVSGPGEGAVTAWFGSRIAVARITVPYPGSVDRSLITDAPRRNFIDELNLKQLAELNLPPSPRCSDEVFIRRVMLDTIGTLPTPEEVRTFLADESPDRRDRLIDSLLERPEFTDYWSYHWSDLLMVNGTLLRPDAVKAYYSWIREQVENDTPWDQFVRGILTARGSSIKNGATNFYALHQTPEDMAENASQAFLGLSIACAKCHNHPLEKWTNDQYYSFANLFARVRAKGWGGDSRNGNGVRTLVTVASGELTQPRTGLPQPPAPLDANPIGFDDPRDRRELLAEWMTSPDNRMFARAVTNRIWKLYFGRGLVESVDDMRASNPASNEELLNAAAAHLVDSGFQMKELMRAVLQSETYQRSSTTLPGNAADKVHYSHYLPRRLMAEVMLDAVSQVTSVPTEFNQIAFPGGDTAKTEFYPEGTRAIQLYDSAVESYFLQTFGRNQRRITCECERSNEPSMVQVLHISNGDTINRKLSAEKSRVTEWLTQYTEDPQAAVDSIFLTTLAREPSAEEQQEIRRLLDEADESERRTVLEDVVWAVISSREFLFNH